MRLHHFSLRRLEKMYCNTEDWDTDEDFEMYTGTALEIFLKVDPQSSMFRIYVHRITNSIRHVYPNYRPVNFHQDKSTYKTFLSELRDFLKDMACPYKEFTSACIEVAIQNKNCRRRILKFLNLEYISAMKINNFFLKQGKKIGNRSCKVTKDTPGTSSCTNNEKHKLDAVDTVPDNERNVGPGKKQSSQIPQVVDEPTKQMIPLEKKLGELTIDTQEPSQSLIPTLQQDYATPVHRNAGVAQYGYGNQNMLPNQQQGYQPPPALDLTSNFAFPNPPYLPSNQTNTPIQTDWINPVNQNMQGTYQNRGLNDNIRFNLNHQWLNNMPSPYSHYQTLNIPQPQTLNCRPEYWNIRGSGNIPITQNNQLGWSTQGPRNTGLSLFGNSNNDQQVGRVQGGEYQNQGINFGNMQSHRPPMYYDVSVPRQQETYFSHGDEDTYYITNISIYPGQGDGDGQSGITIVLPFYSGNDNRIQRRGNIRYTEY